MNSVAIEAPVQCKIENPEEAETFAALIFYPDGSVSIQTSVSYYFFATALFHAASALRGLRNGDTSKLINGTNKNMVDLDAPQDGSKLIVLPDLVEEAINADEVTSNWPGVVDYFDFLRQDTTATREYYTGLNSDSL